MFRGVFFFTNKLKHPNSILTLLIMKVKAQYAGGLLINVHNL